MVTKTLVRVSDGAIMSTVAVTAPNYGNRNNHQTPKKNDGGSEDKKIAAKETAVKHPLGDNMSYSEVDVDNMSTTHVVAKTTDEKKSTATATATGTRRSNRQKRPVEVDSDDPDDEDAGIDKKKRSRMQGKEKELIIDLTGVPNQQPILKKHDGKKGGLLSKYLGVHWDKARSKWRVQITIDGKQSFIGYYDSEEVAATDYARAVFKYKGESDGIECLKAQQRGKASLEKIDLTGVPKQQLIMKPSGKGSSTSKYVGVSWKKASNKWLARITIDGTNRHVGSYDNEEDAAADYARAVFKYNGGNDGIERLKAQQHSRASLEKLNLTDVPKQQLIMKPNGKGSSTSMYRGVSFNKAKNKWIAQIRIDGKERHVGMYDNEEDAAADYARAAFKYKGGNAEVKRQDEMQQLPLNLIQVSAIPPAGYDPIKGGPISALKVTEYEI